MSSSFCRFIHFDRLSHEILIRSNGLLEYQHHHLTEHIIRKRWEDKKYDRKFEWSLTFFDRSVYSSICFNHFNGNVLSVFILFGKHRRGIVTVNWLIGEFQLNLSTFNLFSIIERIKILRKKCTSTSHRRWYFS